MAARDENFLDGPGSTVDPFTGLAPALTPEEEATQRLLTLRRSAQQNANINNAPGGYASQRGASDRSAQFHGNPSQVIDAYIYNKPGPDGLPISREEYEAAKALQKGNHDAMNSGAYKALTYGILAAPAVVTGGALAAGGPSALGFGTGEAIGSGAAAGSSFGQAAGVPATGAVTSMASPYAAGTVGAGTTMGAAGTAGGAAGAAGAAAKSGGAAGFFNSVGKPVLGALAPLAIQQLTKGPTKEQKQLIELQKQMSLEAQQRQGQLQDARMNQLGQQVLAFNPTNQLMAQMYGPQAAFSPEQAAQMVQGQEPPMNPDILNYAGTDQAKLQQKREMIRRHNEWLQSEGQRRDMMMNNFQAPGAGPAPINMPAPQAARRF